MPPRDEPPLREEPELLERPKPPDELGLLEGCVLEALVADLPKERCDWVGLEMTLALAAIFWALGDAAGLEMTGCDELVTPEPAVRDFIELS